MIDTVIAIPMDSQKALAFACILSLMDEYPYLCFDPESKRGPKKPIPSGRTFDHDCSSITEKLDKWFKTHTSPIELNHDEMCVLSHACQAAYDYYIIGHEEYGLDDSNPTYNFIETYRNWKFSGN